MSNIINCLNKFKAYTTSIVFDENNIKNECLSEFFAHGSVYGTPVIMFNISDDDINQALNYWYKKATMECKQFNKPDLLAKLSVEKDGFFFRGAVFWKAKGLCLQADLIVAVWF